MNAGALARALFGVAIAILSMTSPHVHGERTDRPDPSACAGTWDGTAVQDGEPWTIAMVVKSTSGPRCGTIDYPSLGCGGYLIACRVRKGRVHFRERYDRNPGICAPAGTIEAHCTGDSMTWIWRGSDMTIRTTLNRRAATQ
jgi:hypothetical protein